MTSTATGSGASLPVRIEEAAEGALVGPSSPFDRLWLAGAAVRAVAAVLLATRTDAAVDASPGPRLVAVDVNGDQSGPLDHYLPSASRLGPADEVEVDGIDVLVALPPDRPCNMRVGHAAGWSTWARWRRPPASRRSPAPSASSSTSSPWTARTPTNRSPSRLPP
jgi:hypothetical protein